MPEADIDALAAPITHSCTFGAPGDGCIFDVVATGGGNLQADKRADATGERWRTTVAIVDTKTVLSNVGTGSTSSYTGLVKRTVANGKRYNVAVLYEAPLPGTFPTTVEVRFQGTALDQDHVTIAGLRPRGSGDPPCLEEPRSCMQVDESPIAVAAVDVESVACGTLMICKIDPIGDTDAFTFAATAGGAASISIARSRGSTGTPCWRLFNPSGQALTGFVCNSIASVSLATTGTYTIEVAESSIDQPVDYSLSLQLVGG